MMNYREFVCGDVFTRTCGSPMKKGEVIEGHSHNFPHMSLCLLGSVQIKARLPDGERMRNFYAPSSQLLNRDEAGWARRCVVEIADGIHHEITALEDDTVFWCIYVPRDPETRLVIPHYNGWEPAYGICVSS
jgi:hypothetical protein